MNELRAAARVVLAVDETGIPAALLQLAVSISRLQHLPLLAQLRLDPGLEHAAGLAFVSLVDRSGGAAQAWTPAQVLRTRRRIREQYEVRLREVAAGLDRVPELESLHCSRDAQLAGLVASEDVVVMAGLRPVPGEASVARRVIMLSAAPDIATPIHGLLRQAGSSFECWAVGSHQSVSAAIAAITGTGVTLVVSRHELGAGVGGMLRDFLANRGRGLVVLP
jgi:hypothetical protein